MVYLQHTNESFTTVYSSVIIPQDACAIIPTFGKKVISYCESSSLEKFLKFKQDYMNKYSTGQIPHPLSKILNYSDSNSWASIHYVCKLGHSGLLSELISLGADYNSITSDDWTPLMLASFHGFVMCVEMLVSKPDINIDCITSKGSALHMACIAGRTKVVKLLLDFKANPNLEDKEGKIPLECTNKTSILELIPRYVGKSLLLKYCKSIENEDKDEKEFTGELFWQNPWQINDKIVLMKVDFESLSILQYSKRNKFGQGVEADFDIPASRIIGFTYEEVLATPAKYFIHICTEREIFKYYSKQKEEILIWTEKFSELKKKSDLNKRNSSCPSISATNRASTSTSPRQILSDSFDELEFEENDEDDKETPVSFASFEILEEVGQGSFGKVFKVAKKTSGLRYAMKAVSKQELKRSGQYKYIVAECRIQKSIIHPFIVKLFWAFQTPNNIYMVFEYCPFGDLSKLLKTSTRLPEPVVKFFISEVLLALEYLHSLDIIFRDLKPENILIDEMGHAKLGDFGLAKENINQSNPASTFCGSPGYLAPEIIKNEKVWKPADVYSLGICIYELLCGALPFSDKSVLRLYKQIASGNITYPNYFSSAAKSLIKSLTHKNPEKRPKISDIKNHCFFDKVDWKNLASKTSSCPLDFRMAGEQQNGNYLIEDRDYSKVEDRLIASVLL